MKEEPIFAVSQLSRLDKFSIITRIHNNGSQHYVVKAPSNTAAEHHIAQLADTYSKLLSINELNEQISIVKATLRPDKSVHFPFIEGENVERRLFNKILENDIRGIYGIIDRFLAVIDALPSHSCTLKNIPKYSEVFGAAYTRKELECLDYGIVDFNLDNLIEDRDGKWHLIDYEWAFDFPVPKIYVIQRFFYWFFIVRYQEIFRYHAERIKQCQIAANIAIPVSIMDRYEWVFKDLQNVIDSETSFQNYVLGYRPQLAPAVLYPKNKRSEIKQAPTSIIEHYFEIPTLLKHITNLEEDITNIRKDSEILRKELNDIKSSRQYRIANKVARAKHKLVRKISR